MAVKNTSQFDLAGTLENGDFVPLWQVGPGQQRKVTLATLAAFFGAGGGSYTLPVATASVLGGVKQGSGVAIAGDGTLSVTPYNLPAATVGTLGGMRPGSGLAVDGSGIVSVTYSYTLPTATGSVLGGVKVGAGLAIDGGGVLSATYSYTLPTAGASTLGGIKVGAGLALVSGDVLTVAAPVVTDSTTARTATAAMAGEYTRFTNAGTKAYTFNSTTNTYVVGQEYHLRNVGAGNLTLTAAGGMVLNAPAGGTLVVPQGGTATVKIVASGEADVIGVTVAA